MFISTVALYKGLSCLMRYEVYFLLEKKNFTKRGVECRRSIRIVLKVRRKIFWFFWVLSVFSEVVYFCFVTTLNRNVRLVLISIINKNCRLLWFFKRIIFHWVIFWRWRTVIIDTANRDSTGQLYVPVTSLGTTGHEKKRTSGRICIRSYWQILYRYFKVIDQFSRTTSNFVLYNFSNIAI